MAMREAFTENGKLLGAPSGIPSTTVFRGVPYAAKPIGERRWKAPEPVENWEGTRLAHSFSPIAVQPRVNVGNNRDLFSYDEAQSEDCLYLNIWTPADSSAERLPVMIWFHGGAYYAGYGYASQFDGDCYASKGVILVTVNYRLGILGFMAHPELSAENKWGSSGNYGILDQIASIKWVRRNISAFGGDPDNITIFGQSAGAGSVQTLISSPLTKGDIHHAIIQSGVSAKHTPFIDSQKMCALQDFSVKLFEKMGIRSIAEARSMDAQEFYKKSQAAQAELMGPFGMPFKPCVDGRVLTMHQEDYAKAGLHPDIDYLVGHTDEILLDAPVMTLEQYETALQIRYGDEADKMKALFHIKDEEELNRIRPCTMRAALAAASHAWCRNNNRLGYKKSSYYYYFDHKIPGDGLGAFHSGELWYCFGTLHRCWRPLKWEDHEISRIMSSYWTNFAKTGDPNGEGLPGWHKYTEENHAVMLIDPGMRCVNERLNPGLEYLVQKSLADESEKV
jgi:para-nitrobenzyl esterase